MTLSARAPLFLAILLCATTACQKRTTCFRVTAFVENAAGEDYIENFPDGAFMKNALGNYQIAFELPPRRMPIHPMKPVETPPADTSDDAAAGPPIVANAPAVDREVPDEVYIAQFVIIDLMWRPEPGTTFVESTQTNAGLTYCLVRGGDTVRYDGAGFVYFQLDRDGTTMTGRVESATLYRSKATSDMVDILGPCRVTADFVAHHSARRVTDVQRKLVGASVRHASVDGPGATR
ncbi:MAG: hypothetical protein KDA33_12510 [Phycisphaerales bacterium]|nr:hypothetical protein [Phycisphaerales bacterium]